MEVIVGNENHAERQVIQIGDVNFVVGFACRPHAGDQVRGHREIEKQVHAVNVPKIRRELAYRR